MRARRTILVRGGNVLTMDPAIGDLDGADIVIHGSRIVEIGYGLRPAIRGEDQVIDAAGKIVIPGMIDNHWHMWQGLVPGVSAEHTFGEYFATALDDLSVRFTPADVELGVRLSALAGIMAGKTTVLNWDHGARTPDHAVASVRALQATGIRAIEAYGPPANSREWFDSAAGPYPDDVRELVHRYRPAGGLVGFALAVRGPEFSTMRRVHDDLALARELGIRVTMHAGIPGFFAEYNSPLLLERAGLLADDLTFVHCNAMRVEDFRRIGAHGAHVSCSPEVEMQMGFGRSPLDAMLDGGVRPVVSADVPAAIGADLLTQVRFLVQRQREHDNALVAEAGTGSAALVRYRARATLAYITTNAAASLGLSSKIGSITPGKQADLVLVDAWGDPATALRDPYPALLQAAHPGNITDVLVAGRPVKRDGALVDVGTDQWLDLIRRAAVANARLRGCQPGATAEPAARAVAEPDRTVA